MRTYNSLKIETYITWGFLSLILAGTLLLWACNAIWGERISLLDALFLSTSSVCVTGLSTVDIGRALPLPSQLVMVVLIQLGGIGIMATTTTLLLLAGHRLRVRDRLYLAGGFGMESPRGVIRLLHMVIAYTLLFEAAGALLLFFKFLAEAIPAGRALHYAVFHSVSAFCNAGFSPFSDNLEGYAGTYFLPAVVMTLVAAGGIGFPVIAELVDYRKKRISFLSPYAKLVLLSSAALTLGGGLLLAFTEWDAAFAHLPAPLRFWNGLFGSVTARTAGFDTVPYATWSAEGSMITILLMLIGASPSSTGGGMKTTTFVVLLWSAWTELRQNEEVRIWHRQIPPATIRRALAFAFLYLFTLFAASLALSAIEPLSYASLAFEAVSALGTVGLTRGITTALSPAGKMVIILLMFWGRVGLLTFFFSIVPKERLAEVHLPATNVPIG